MRPIKLTIQALGPYASTQEIDFNELGDRHFFLLHGPTGSGKSTLLDSICYGLYGETSGVDRKVADMKSQWAPRGTTTRVIFDFSLGKEIYRVQRSPAQEVSKKRGDGFKSLSAKARLWKRTDAKDGEEGELLCSGSGKVTSQIEKLLGFKSDQFRQVILLPQGKFREVLAADSGKREEILQILFGTHLYKRLEEALKDRAREVRKNLEALTDREKNLWENSGITSLTEGEARGLELQKEIIELKKTLEALKKEEDSLSSKIGAARALEEKFRQREQAEKDLKKLEVQKEEILERKRVWERGEKAALLKEFYRAFGEREQEHHQILQERVEAEKAKEESEKKKEKAEKAFLEAEKKREEEALFQKKKIDLEKFLEKAQKLAGAEKEEEEALRAWQGLEKEREHLEKKREQLKKIMEEKKRDLEESKMARAELGSLKAYLEKLQEGKSLLQELEGLLKKQKILSLEGKEKEKKQGEISSLLEKLQTDYTALEDRWRRSQASLLARDLKPGKECPVCGSTKHPHKAPLEEGTPDWVELQKIKGKITPLEREKNQIDREVIRLAVEFQKEEEESKKIRYKLDVLSLKETKDLEKSLQKSQREYREKEKKSNQVEEVEKEVLSLEKETAEREKELEEKYREVQKAAQAKIIHQERVASLKGDIPPAYRQPRAIQREMEQMEKKLEALQKGWERARKAYQETGELLSLQSKLLEEKENTLKKALEKVAEKRKALEEELAAKGFPHLEAYRKALMDEGELEKLKGELAAFGKALALAQDRFDQTVKSLKNSERPDLTALEREFKNFKGEVERTLGKQKERETALKQLLQVSQKGRELLKKKEDLDYQFSLVQTLSELTSGKNKLKTPFHRFVLGALLDEVLEAASDRLILMSKGRYKLYRSLETMHGKRTGGLDLEIFDEWTGEPRPASTLSGGEGFLASLSLALGLADVVQQHTGGIHLNAIFIDEGFGSLDSENLDMAISTLTDLQVGNRLVGIISHVPELKERIDTRLEVIPGKKGSTVRWVV